MHIHHNSTILPLGIYNMDILTKYDKIQAQECLYGIFLKHKHMTGMKISIKKWFNNGIQINVMH